jgi:hypothetical protein
MIWLFVGSIAIIVVIDLDFALLKWQMNKLQAASHKLLDTKIIVG